MSRDHNPKFVSSVGMGGSMQLTPPFDFDGVTLRIFPLRASQYKLQRFVDGYLNIVPPQVARFRVPIPFVYLMLINYGRMSVDAANLGWISQYEILFCVPLEQYQLVDGKYVFLDWAYVSPFIYVDNPLSMTTGREVYGWPKSLANLDAELSTWMDDPLAKPRVACASTMLFSDAYAGKRLEPRTFLEVSYLLPPSPLRFPPDLKNPALPWVAIPNAIWSSADTMRDCVDILKGMGILRKQRFLSPPEYLRMAEQAARYANPYDPLTSFNTVNLKQFRSADSPSSVCYQAITSAKMETTRFKGAGLLGDINLLLGDTSGGYRIHVQRYDSTPVIECLGLEVEEEWHGPGGVNVASLKPVLPLWMETDMRYNPGQTLAWRTKVTEGWKVGTGPETKHYRDKGRPAQSGYSPYNTLTGAASQEVAGPFDFPDTTLRVLPLLADPEKLANVCKELLNDPLRWEGMTFEPYGRYVYLVISSYEGVASETNDIGWWADRDVVFYIPVKWYDVVDGQKKLRSLALLPIFSYANSATAAITGSEVSGIPMMTACVEAPRGTWLSSSGPGASTTDPLLRMTTKVLPVLGEGQGAEDRVILEVQDGPTLPSNDDEAWRRVAERWGGRLRREVAHRWETRRDHEPEFDDALALALEILGNERPLNVLTLKQFRDSWRPDRACYQSLVLIRKSIRHIYDIREIEDATHLSLHDYPSQPIVSTLGIVAKNVTLGSGGRVFHVEPVRPFWMRVSLREFLGVTICRRAGSERWEPDPDTIKNQPIYYFGAEPDPRHQKLPLHRGIADHLYPRRLRSQVRGDLPVGLPPGTSIPADRLPAEGPPIGTDDAVRAVEAIEPQMVIEAMLSREWENWAEPRWEKAREALVAELGEATRGKLPEDEARVQRELLHAKITQRRMAEFGAEGQRLVKRFAWLNTLETHLTTVSKGFTRMSLIEKAEAEAGSDDAILAIVGPIAVQTLTEDPDTADTVLRALARFSDEERATFGPEMLQKVFATARDLSIKLTREQLGNKQRHEVEEQLGDVMRILLREIWSKPRSVRENLERILIEDARSAYQDCLSVLVSTLALQGQKPDHVVRRASLDTFERDLALPRIHTVLDGAWYVGPVLEDGAAQKSSAAAVISVGAVLELAPPRDDQPVAFSADPLADLGRLLRVVIWHADVIDALQCEHEHAMHDRIGGTGGRRDEIVFGPHEHLVEVSGLCGDYFGGWHPFEVVLKTRTDGQPGDKTYGPYGTGLYCRDPQRFSLKADRKEIVALTATSAPHADGTEYVSKIDVTVAPLPVELAPAPAPVIEEEG